MRSSSISYGRDSYRRISDGRGACRSPALTGAATTRADQPAERTRTFALELLDIVRKLSLRSRITEEQADRVVHWLREAPIAQARHLPLVPRAWELRHNIRPYDGAYVALAEELDVTLVTAGTRLGRSTGYKAEIEVHPLSG